VEVGNASICCKSISLAIFIATVPRKQLLKSHTLTGTGGAEGKINIFSSNQSTALCRGRDASFDHWNLF